MVPILCIHNLNKKEKLKNGPLGLTSSIRSKLWDLKMEALMERLSILEMR